MSYSRTKPGERGRITDVYAREAAGTYNGYHHLGAGMVSSTRTAPVASTGTRMVSRTVTPTTVAPTRRVVSSKPGTSSAGSSTVPTRPGYTWVPAAGGIAGHWVRKAAADRTVVNVVNTAPDEMNVDRWCRYNGFSAAYDLAICRRVKNRPNAKDWTAAMIRDLIAREKAGAADHTTVRDRRVPSGPVGTPGTTSLPGEITPKDPSLPPWQGPGAATIPGGGGSTWGGGGGSTWGGGGGSDMESWRGGAQLPGLVAPESRPQFRRSVPWGLVAAGGLGAVALYLVLTKKRKK